jgi:hypothetical protein
MKKLQNKTTRSQCSRLLNYLKDHKRGITTYEAFSVLGIHRISARIADLRQRGYKIDTIMHREEVDGMPKIWGQYILRRTA